MQTDDFWADFYERDRDEEVEHVRARELAHRERLDEKGLPHAFKCYDPESAWVEDTKRSLGLTPRRPARFSQCSKLLALLENGEWWTTRELLREVPCVVHSRMAELRKRGYVIEHETTGAGAAGSRYRLVDAGSKAA